MSKKQEDKELKATTEISEAEAVNDDAEDSNGANGFGITGLCCGVASIVLFWVPGLHFVVTVCGIVFSGIAMSKGQKKFGVPGLVLSLASYVIVAIYFIWIAIMISASM